MKLRRPHRRHVLVDRSEWAQLIAALNLRGDREAAEAVRAAPRRLDGSDPRVSRALSLLAELREGAPVNPEATLAGRRPKIAVPLRDTRRP